VKAHEPAGERCVVCPSGCKVDRRADVADPCAVAGMLENPEQRGVFDEEPVLLDRRGVSLPR